MRCRTAAEHAGCDERSVKATTIEEQFRTDVIAHLDLPASDRTRLTALVRRMLEERGYAPDDPVVEPPGEEDEIVSAYRAAAEVTRLVEQEADSVSLGDVAGAIENYRDVFNAVISQRSAP